jgi:hypothetical protein
MKSFLVSAVAIFVLSSACGGRVQTAHCDADPNAPQLCYDSTDSPFCCPMTYVCGNGQNNCPDRGCCLPTPTPAGTGWSPVP